MPNNRRGRRPYRQQFVPNQGQNPGLVQHGHWAGPPQPHHSTATPPAAMAEERSPSAPCDELAKLRQELAKEKALKEMYINKGKETRRELETLQKYCQPESLDHSRVAQQIRDTVKHKKKKKLLQVDFEELQVAFVFSQDRFQRELELERTISKDLREELFNLTSSFNELSAKLDEQTLSLGEGESVEEEPTSGSQDCEELKDQISGLQRQLDEEKQQKSDVEKEIKKLQLQSSSCQDEQTAALQQEKERTLCLEGRLEERNQTLQDKEEEAAKLQQQLEAEAQQATLLKEQHEELQKLHEDTLSHAEEEVRKYQQDVEQKDDDNKNLLQQLEELQDKLRESEMQLQELRGLTTEEEEKLPEKKKPSFWKRLRHFLGLRKSSQQ